MAYLNVGYRPVTVIPDPDPHPAIDAIQMRVLDIQDGFVMVETGLTDGDKFHSARAFTLPFDTNGDATLSLWTKRVRLHHNGKTVSVTGTDEGTYDGPQLDEGHVFEIAK